MLGSSVAAIPLGSNDLPFIFNETTADYQTISIQGQLTQRITQPKQLAELLDFTVNSSGSYKNDGYCWAGGRSGAAGAGGLACVKSQELMNCKPIQTTICGRLPSL